MAREKPWTIRAVQFRMPDGSLKDKNEFSPEELREMWARVEERGMRNAGYEPVPAEEAAARP